MSDQDSIIVTFHPDVTEDQIAAFIEVMEDLFKASGGKSGLKVERVTHVEAAKHEFEARGAYCRHGRLRRFCGPCHIEQHEKR